MIPSEPQVPWYFRKKFLVICLLIAGPLALPLFWLNPQYDARTKIIWTVVIVGATYLTSLMLDKALKFLVEYYQLSLPA